MRIVIEEGRKPALAATAPCLPDTFVASMGHPNAERELFFYRRAAGKHDLGVIMPAKGDSYTLTQTYRGPAFYSVQRVETLTATVQQ